MKTYPVDIWAVRLEDLGGMMYWEVLRAESAKADYKSLEMQSVRGWGIHDKKSPVFEDKASYWHEAKAEDLLLQILIKRSH